ncbi:hypothetical protein V2J23_07615 [Geobacillus thermoleovorans]
MRIAAATFFIELTGSIVMQKWKQVKREFIIGATVLMEEQK